MIREYLPQNFPKIVCICGSTRYPEAFRKATLHETLNGNIVLTIGCNMRTDPEFFDITEELRKPIKIKLDELHKRKIDISDEVLILNVNNYIGESTQSELSYAYNKNKVIRFLQPSEALIYNWNKSNT